MRTNPSLPPHTDINTHNTKSTHECRQSEGTLLMMKLDMHPVLPPLIHPWLSIKCMKFVDGCSGEKKQETQPWRITGRSDGGWGTPSRGWDRTALRTSNVCHSRKLMMPRSWANHPPAVCEKRDRQRERTEGGVAGTWMQSEEVRCSCGVSLGVGRLGEHWRSKNIYDNQHPSWHRWVILRWMIYPPLFSSQSKSCLLPSSASFIESSYLLRFMRNLANLISSQSLGCYVIVHGEKGGGGGRFGWWAESVIIYSQLGSSNLWVKGKMGEGWGLKCGKMLREIAESGLVLCKSRGLVQGLVSQNLLKSKIKCLWYWWCKHMVNQGGKGLQMSEYQSGLNLS